MNRLLRNHPRILLVSARHYLMAELAAGCQALGIEHEYLFLGGVASGAELEAQLQAAVQRLRPHFLLTMNLLGLDREGLVSEFCRVRSLPLLNWFVDRPELFLPEYSNLDNPWLVHAAWDRDAVEWLRASGHADAFHLPLAADLSRIRFEPERAACRDTGFVGNSMQAAVERCWGNAAQSEAARPFWDAVAMSFAQSESRALEEHMRDRHPQALDLRSRCNAPARLALDGFLYWRATQLYRLDCLRALLPFAPVVAGDGHWQTMLPPGSWTYAAPLQYYSDLPDFYRETRVSFNTTSMQMKGALNQRVFDVPASGGFLLTDWREQLGEAFEEGREVVCYREVGEIGDVLRHYLANPSARLEIVRRARQRIEREHSYAHRIAVACREMRRIHGTPA